MNMASPVKDNDQKKLGSSSKQNSGHHELKPEDIDGGSTAFTSAGPDNIDSDKLIIPVENDENVRCKSGNIDMKHVVAKISSKSARKGNKTSPKLRSRIYLLRSSVGGARVLRSMSKGKCMAPTESVSTPAKPVTVSRRKRRKVKTPSNDEFSRARKRVRYLLTRMSYEQNLIDAYSGEGWKGQSLEKIKPEKELERAKSEILRCKSKMRDLFRHLDSLLSEGTLQESLFDSEGQISSDDIFCAKCGSKDLSADNDIILCDGTCNRGFHQKCLNPPLLSEDVPPGDEGWLCPACDCKVDCIDLLNEFQGSGLSLEDMWEKVFPEAAILNGDNQYDYSGLPSDDSEDDDYNPDAPKVDVEDQEDGSSSEESDFTFSSEDSDSRASKRDKHCDNLGLPSDDSEDDDYDPDGPDPNEENHKNGSNSDESDFTSDSDVFMEELNKPSDANGSSASLLSNLNPLDHPGEGRCASDTKKSSINSEVLSILEPDMNEENALPVSGKRHRERLDYKKLYDETYGKTSSDSSDDDDDDWCGMSTPKKGKKDDIGEESLVLPKANTRTVENHRSSRSSMGKLSEVKILTEAGLVQQQVSQVMNENTPERIDPKLNPTVANHSAEQHSGSQEPDSNGNKATTVWRSLGRTVSQKLLESFKENQYPTRETKERLAEELGKTVRQVDKWFGNARHSARVAAKEASQSALSTPGRGANLTSTGGNRTNSDEVVGETSARSMAKVGESSQAGNPIVGNEPGRSSISNGDKTKTVDKNRQKAIARELRKMRKIR